MTRYSKRVVLSLVLLFGSEVSPAVANPTFISCGPNGETFEIQQTSSGAKFLINGKKCTGVVVIPDGVNHIGPNAFAGSKITHLEMPDSVKSLEPNVFNGSTITSIKLSNSLAEIPKGTFQASSLNEVVIPDSVTLIGENAFAGSKLTRAILGKSVRHLSSGAFNAPLIKYISIPNSLQTFGMYPLSPKSLERIDYCGPLYKPDLLSGLFLIAPTCENVDNQIVAAAELKAKQEAEAKSTATKKVTITCIKGKLFKKVTAVKPKCPTGFKVKK